MTSQIPIPMPAGSDVSTSERTPGEASAPKRPARAGRGRGRIARDGPWAVKAIVPIHHAHGGNDQCGGRATSASPITAVSSGPATKISSIITESSA